MRALLVGMLVLAACSDGQKCGTATVTSTLAATAGGTMLAVPSTFTASQNNDCPFAGDKTVSVTVSGSGAGAILTLCLPQPDKLGDAPVSLADTSLVRVIDVSLDGGGCSYTRDSSMAPQGTVTFAGFCTDKGVNFTMTFDGTIPAHGCADGGTGATISLSGTTNVTTQ